MPRVKGKKKAKDQQKELVEEKKKLLQKLWDFLQTECQEYEAHLNTICAEVCSKIKKLYDDKLNSLPEEIRNMTLSEYLEAERKSRESKKTDIQMLASQYKESKLFSEKKKTAMKIRSERKRSFSASSTTSGRTINSNMSRILSESSLHTPLSKRSVVPQFVITPKFNPKVPISKGLMRKPKAGEVVLSVSGSPLLNFADDVAISLGAGNIIKIDDRDTKLDEEFLKQLDQTTKSTLENVKKKLDLIMKAKP